MIPHLTHGEVQLGGDLARYVQAVRTGLEERYVAVTADVEPVIRRDEAGAELSGRRLRVVGRLRVDDQLGIVDLCRRLFGPERVQHAHPPSARSQATRARQTGRLPPHRVADEVRREPETMLRSEDHFGAGRRSPPVNVKMPGVSNSASKVADMRRNAASMPL